MKYCLIVAVLALFSCNNQPAPMTKEDSANLVARYKEVTDINNTSVPAGFLHKIKQNSVIVDADITDEHFLYISVVNDGTNKDAMAEYYCRLARESGIGSIAAVKIVDAATAKMPHNGTAQGTEIGKVFCK